MDMKNENLGIDAKSELLKLAGRMMNENKDEFYDRIKKNIPIDNFMEATDNNLNMLYKFMYSSGCGMSLSNVTVGKFIKDEYGDDFFFTIRDMQFTKGETGFTIVGQILTLLEGFPFYDELEENEEINIKG